MLPLIPALLLLILNGPASAEQPLNSGPWSAAIRALYARTEQASNQQRNIAVDKELAKAICCLLRAETKCVEHPIVEPAQETSRAIAAVTPNASDGFAACQRSRDGPAPH